MAWITSTKNMRPVPFAEFRTFLQKFGYEEKRVPQGRVFLHPEEGLLLYRYYCDDELVFPRDLLRTRTFFDLRGIIEADDYDATLLWPNRPAMTMTRPIIFAELRAFLQRLGCVEKSAATARVFKHPEEGQLLFRSYRDDEAVELHDIVFTRKFLDLRGVIEAGEFDATLLRADTPA